MTSPSRVTLTVRTPGRFGNEISFCPPQRFRSFAKSPIVAPLIQSLQDDVMTRLDSVTIEELCQRARSQVYLWQAGQRSQWR